MSSLRHQRSSETALNMPVNPLAGSTSTNRAAEYHVRYEFGASKQFVDGREARAMMSSQF
jgi:hypothetical protein